MQKIHKISIDAIPVLVMLMALTPSAFAAIDLPSSHHPQAAYKSGFEYGITDGKAADGVQWYILQRGNGFAFHSSEFVKDVSLEGSIGKTCSI